MKYLIQISIFGIGTIFFLLAWYLADKTLTALVGVSILVTIISFLIGLLVGWAVDALLVTFLPEKYK